MPSMDVNGNAVDVDEEGYLTDINDWNRDIASALAETEEVELTDAHWEVIDFLREYYDEYQIAPAVRVLTKAIGKKLGRTKATASTSTSCSHMAQRSRLVRLVACLSLLAVSKLNNQRY